MKIMKKLLLLFCLTISMLTQAWAQGNNPYVIHIYDGRTFAGSEKDQNDVNTILLTSIMTGTPVNSGNGIFYYHYYSPDGKFICMCLMPNNPVLTGVIAVASGLTVADNYGRSFTEEEIKILKGSFLDGYTGVVIDFSKDNIPINSEYFPDENFRVCLQSESYGKDYVLTPEEISGITEIIVAEKEISSLKGIEYFTALEYLYCDGNQLTSLDVSKNTALTLLSCGGNQLTSLDVSKNTALKQLSCGGNQLTSLDVSKNTALTKLYCYYNQLTSLDVSKNTALTELSCGVNQLTSLDVSKNTALTELYCYNNQLTSLDVSKNTALTVLYCDNIQLTSLDVSKNTALEYLYCDGNQLTSLDVSKNTALEYLSCYNNQLTSLDVSKNTALTVLYCDVNQLTSLDVSKNTALTVLSCGGNQLTSLDVSKNAALTELSCGYNQLTSLVVSNKTALETLWCYGNQIKGAQTEALVNSLPKVTDGKLYFCDPTDAAEKNEITDAQVAKAKAKIWTVMAWNGSDWEEYAGTTGIGNVEQAEPGAVRTYTLDGRPVGGQPAKPGIYIRNGKKIMVK